MIMKFQITWPDVSQYLHPITVNQVLCRNTFEILFTAVVDISTRFALYSYEQTTLQLAAHPDRLLSSTKP